MSLYVPLTLDKPRRLQFTFMDLDKVCDYLNGQRSLREDVDGIGKVLSLLGRMHPPTYGAVLWAGLSHQDEKIKNPEQAKKILAKYLEKGGSLEPVGEAIIEAMYKSGLITKEAYDLAKARRGGADAETDGASSPEEEDPTPIRGSEHTL